MSSSSIQEILKSVEKKRQLLNKHKKEVEKVTKKASELSAAYDRVFDLIRASTKQSDDHISLLIIEDAVNEYAMRFKRRLESAINCRNRLEEEIQTMLEQGGKDGSGDTAGD